MNAANVPSLAHSLARGDARSSDSDDQLARLAQAGCRDSFDVLVRRFQVRLLRFLQGRVRSNSDAEDLLQETFVRAFMRLDQYDPTRSFATWLFTIAHRLAVSHHRRALAASRANHVAGERLSGRVETEPGRHMADEESRQAFWEQAARVLSEEQLCATWLFYVEEMPAPQIAKVLGRSWVSVKTILFRSRRKLSSILDESLGNDVNAIQAPQARRVWRLRPWLAADVSFVGWVYSPAVRTPGEKQWWASTPTLQIRSAMRRFIPSSFATPARLAKLARREADQLSPHFSEMRHLRIIRAVDLAQSRPQRAMQLVLQSSRRSWRVPFAVAAALMLVAFAGKQVWQPGVEVTRGQLVIDKPMAPAVTPLPVSANPEPPVLSLDQATQQVNVRVQGAVASAFAEQQWAGLDHDVRAATLYLVDQVPLRATWQSDGAQEER